MAALRGNFLHNADPQRITRSRQKSQGGSRFWRFLYPSLSLREGFQDPRAALLSSPAPARDLANGPTEAFLCGFMGHVNQVCEKNDKSPAVWPLCPLDLAYLLLWLLLMEVKRLQNLPEA